MGEDVTIGMWWRNIYDIFFRYDSGAKNGLQVLQSRILVKWPYFRRQGRSQILHRTYDYCRGSEINLPCLFFPFLLFLSEIGKTDTPRLWWQRRKTEISLSNQFGVHSEVLKSKPQKIFQFFPFSISSSIEPQNQTIKGTSHRFTEGKKAW